MARRANCTPRRLYSSSTGPKPIEKLLTRIPCQVAAKKCPASCTTISPARIASAVRTPIQALY